MWRWYSTAYPFLNMTTHIIWFIRIELQKQLDESMARRHLKLPRSLCGRSFHLTLVTKWSQSWSWMTYSHPLCSMSLGPPILRYSYFKISLVNTTHMLRDLGHNQAILRSGPTIVPKMKEIQKVVQKLSRGQKSATGAAAAAAPAAAYEPVQKHKVIPVYRCNLMRDYVSSYFVILFSCVESGWSGWRHDMDMLPTLLALCYGLSLMDMDTLPTLLALCYGLSLMDMDMLPTLLALCYGLSLMDMDMLPTLLSLCYGLSLMDMDMLPTLLALCYGLSLMDMDMLPTLLALCYGLSLMDMDMLPTLLALCYGLSPMDMDMLPTLLALCYGPSLMDMDMLPTLLALCYGPSLMDMEMLPTLLALCYGPSLMDMDMLPTLLALCYGLSLMDMDMLPTLLALCYGLSLMDMDMLPTLLRVNKLSFQWFRCRLVTYWTQGHCLNQCWYMYIVNWVLGHNFSYKMQRFSFVKMNFKLSSVKWGLFCWWQIR